MTPRILLVDDEKLFLQSLKQGLDHLTDIFITDTCFSVAEAIRCLETNRYDLVITDIRMPKKSGIDLLLYLKMNDFSGGIKVMSAYPNDESLKKIGSMGIIDVISKPFDIEWFEEMIIDFFKKRKESLVTFESIDLLTVMQVINLDKNTSALHVEHDGRTGIIYFENGEIINSEYLDMKGEEAVYQLMALRKVNISVKKMKNLVEKTIDMPFVEFMLEAMKKIDENKKDSEINSSPNISKNDYEEENMTFAKNVLKGLDQEVEGLLATSIFGKDGIPIVIENPASLDVDAFSAKFAMVSALVNKSVGELSGGKVAEILVEEEKGWILVRPIRNLDMYLIVAVSNRCTLGNLRLVVKRLTATLEQYGQN